MNESRERIRRERDREKNTYTSPRLALRRVLLLAEGRQFREAAAILSRLGPGVLQTVATELPIDILVEALPHSAHLIETLLNRLISLEITPRPEIQCETVAWRLVGLLGADQGSGLRARTARLAAALCHYTPDARDAIDTRRRQLDAAVQGLGTHGLTADASGTLISLHMAMKNELQRHVEVYKQALHKLEELSPVTISQDPASSSHQRLLALSHADVERRLIDNKSLLTIVDKPALRQLPTLVAALSARVDSDKAVLACVGQIKRSDPSLDLSDTRPVAGVLMSYSRGCAAVLTQMSEGEGAAPAPRSPTDSASDGYHSDSDDSQQHPDRSKLVSQYAAVWARAAEEALPALAALEQLRQTPHLKYKIVFSVVVLSFRAAISLRDRRLSETKALLGVSDDVTGSEPAVARLLAAATRVLHETAHTFPLGDAERTVINQVLSTLREYPSLAGCAPLHALVAASCRAAWTISLHSPPLRIDTDFTPDDFLMDKSERRTYKRIEELDAQGVTDLLEKWQMTEFVEFSKEKQIDGRKLLNITEGIVKLWRPKINAIKLVVFIEDLKTNPVKYLKELNETYDVVLRKENLELKTLNIKYEKQVIITNMDKETNIEKGAVRKDTIKNNLDIESQYQTVKKEKVKENQSNLNNVEEIIKRIVPAKSFLYRNQVKKESTPSYLQMDGSPKRKRLFRLSGYEYPIFDLKRFSKPDNPDRGYYPMKRNSRFFVSKTKPESRTKYKSISITEELKYPEDHFYEDLCYTDIDKPRSSISSNQTVKPYRVKIQELFQSLKIPFFKKNEELEKEKEQSEEKIMEIVEEKRIIVEKEHVYENSDSLNNMYDSVQAPVPISENKVTQPTRLPVEEYLEPCQLNKDYCDVNYRQKEDSILGYILSIFENRLGFWRETNEGATENSDDSPHRAVDDKKWSEEKKGPKANMSDRPLPVPVENEPYYMNIERTEAENLLKGQPDGTFLLRPSSQPNHAYTLSISCNDAVHNIGVRRRPDGRMSLGFARRGERSFSDVTSLIRHHKKRRLLLVAHGEVIGATTLNDSPHYYQTPCNIPIHDC